MKIKDFPVLPEGADDRAKLQALYDWCYNLYQYLKGEKENVKASSESL